MTHEKEGTVSSQWGANLEASWFREVCVEDYDDLVHFITCTTLYQYALSCTVMSAEKIMMT